MVEMEDAMKRWIKRGICALTLGAMLSANVLAAELSLSFDKQGTTAAVELRDVGTDRYAAEVTMDITNPQAVQFQGKGDTYAVTVDSAAGTVTLYVASRTPLTAADGTLDLGTLTVAAGTQVTGVPTATVLDRFLNGTKYETVTLSVTQTSTRSRVLPVVLRPVDLHPRQRTGRRRFLSTAAAARSTLPVMAPLPSRRTRDIALPKSW